MTAEFEIMMRLLKFTETDEEPEINSDVSLKRIYELAKNQGVWPIVFLAVQKLYKNKKIAVKPEVMQGLNQQLTSTMTRCALRKEILKVILDELDSMNITAVLLKGDTLSHLYRFPDYRLSGDIDLLINPKDEKQIFAVFEKNGFNVEKRMNNEHHSICTHPVAGVVELHISLYDDYCEDIWFEGKTQICEDFTEIEITDGYRCKALGLNDSFIYVTMHMIKHFLSCGAGMRQIMDVLLFMKKHKFEIDIERYDKLMKELSFDKFMDCVMDIGVMYLGFKPEELIYLNKQGENDKNVSAVLEDIEKCGLFGHNDEDLREFRKVYLERKYESVNSGSVDEYMSNRLNVLQKLELVFIRRDILEKKYPYVKKSALLVPVAWIHRIVNYIFKRKKPIDEATAEKKEQTFEQRIELMQKLKII